MRCASGDAASEGSNTSFCVDPPVSPLSCFKQSMMDENFATAVRKVLEKRRELSLLSGRDQELQLAGAGHALYSVNTGAGTGNPALQRLRKALTTS